MEDEAEGRHAFGEKVNPQPTKSRYGYAGAWGYQEHDVAHLYDIDPATPDGRPDSHFNASPTTGLPFMHVGHRYYHPGSGRFLQRDPIGIAGGLNVYAYVRSNPSVLVDPMGLFSIEKAIVGTIGGAVGGGIGLLVGGPIGGAVGLKVGLGLGAGAATGGGIGFVTGGWENGDWNALVCWLNTNHPPDWLGNGDWDNTRWPGSWINPPDPPGGKGWYCRSCAGLRK